MTVIRQLRTSGARYPKTATLPLPGMQARRSLSGVALFAVTLLALTGLAGPSAHAQTFTVLHSFTGQGDGGVPQVGVTMDAAGNLYGTTVTGGDPNGTCGRFGCGTVYKLSKRGSNWVLAPLYQFLGSTDGAGPESRVTIARDGTLYGTASGGGVNRSGTVFHLSPPVSAPTSALSPWNINVLYSFSGDTDGGNPQGDLTLDQSGDIYGTTEFFGPTENGVTYQLSRSGGTWTETVIYYDPLEEGSNATPSGGVVFDSLGNLYGVLSYSTPNASGSVYELTPSGSNWTAQTIHIFHGYDGMSPVGGLLVDSSNNVYGTTVASGLSSGGTVFELTPADGGWIFNTLYNITNCPRCGGGPEDKLVMDASGNLYGTTYAGGANQLGSVFKLTPSDNGWVFTSLHDFTGGSDGKNPYGPILDANGNLYGTTNFGGTGNNGVVWEITP